MQKQIPNQMFGFKCLRALPDPGAVGDHVVVKDHGEATIKTISEDGKKISVKFGDAVTTVVAAKKIRQSISAESKGTKVVSCYLTKEYRQMAYDYVFPDDSVLEIGCHEGVTTNIIAKRCRNRVVGIDKSVVTVNDASKRFPKVCFKVVDALNMDSVLLMTQQFLAERPSMASRTHPVAATSGAATDTVAIPAVSSTELADLATTATSAAAAASSAVTQPVTEVAATKKRKIAAVSADSAALAPLDKRTKRMLQRTWTKIFIDIGGNAPLPKVIECVSKVDATFKPEVIVVKSKRFKNLVDRTSVFGHKASFARPRLTRNSRLNAT